MGVKESGGKKKVWVKKKVGEKNRRKSEKSGVKKSFGQKKWG